MPFPIPVAVAALRYLLLLEYPASPRKCSKQPPQLAATLQERCRARTARIPRRQACRSTSRSRRVYLPDKSLAMGDRWLWRIEPPGVIQVAGGMDIGHGHAAALAMVIAHRFPERPPPGVGADEEGCAPFRTGANLVVTFALQFAEVADQTIGDVAGGSGEGVRDGARRSTHVRGW